MEGSSVLYQGRPIAKEGFRAFIYGAQGRKKLVNSWDEFESHIASGVWFSTKDEVKEIKETKDEDVAPKKRSK